MKGYTQSDVGGLVVGGVGVWGVGVWGVGMWACRWVCRSVGCMVRWWCGCVEVDV